MLNEDWFIFDAEDEQSYILEWFDSHYVGGIQALNKVIENKKEKG